MAEETKKEKESKNTNLWVMRKDVKRLRKYSKVTSEYDSSIFKRMLDRIDEVGMGNDE